jgi:transposase
MYAVVVGAPADLRDQLHSLSRHQLITQAAHFRVAQVDDVRSAVRWTLRLLAQRHQALTAEIVAIDSVVSPLIRAHAGALLELRGVGPEVAGALLVVAGDNPQRRRSEASFAALCGVSPLPASSGKTQRHRLNRGGDPRLRQPPVETPVVQLMGEHEGQRLVTTEVNSGYRAV